MSKEILMVVESVSNEKGVSEDIIFDALELALATATKKRYTEEEVDIRVAIDKETGEYDTFRRWEIVTDEGLGEAEFPTTKLTLDEAAEEGLGHLAVGEYHEIPVESVEFGRIAAQTAKQVIVQKVRDRRSHRKLPLLSIHRKRKVRCPSRQIRFAHSHTCQLEAAHEHCK